LAYQRLGFCTASQFTNPGSCDVERLLRGIRRSMGKMDVRAKSTTDQDCSEGAFEALGACWLARANEASRINGSRRLAPGSAQPRGWLIGEQGSALLMNHCNAGDEGFYD
jgi:hypothetical protein